MGLFVALGIILSFIERMIPVPFIAPGAKLGLANIMTVLTLVIFHRKEAFSILLTRILLVSLLFGGMSGLIYSFCGGVLSFVAMETIRVTLKDKDSLVGVSVVGATFHNIGQLMAASIIIANVRMFSYLPALMFTAVATGIFVGLSANFVKERLQGIYEF